MTRGIRESWWLGHNHGSDEALFAEAMLLLDGQPRQKVTQLQRRFRIGYNKAERLQARLDRALQASPPA